MVDAVVDGRVDVMQDDRELVLVARERDFDAEHQVGSGYCGDERVDLARAEVDAVAEVFIVLADDWSPGVQYLTGRNVPEQVAGLLGARATQKCRGFHACRRRRTGRGPG